MYYIYFYHIQILFNGKKLKKYIKAKYIYTLYILTYVCLVL